MHIVHYFHHFSLAEGGVCRAVLDLCTWQARVGAEVTALTYDPEDVPQAWKDRAPGSPRLIVLPPHGAYGGLFRSSVARPFLPVLRQADVLHVHDIWDPVLVPVCRAARAAGTPYVMSPHGMLADWSLSQKRFKKSAYRALFGQSLIDHATFIVLTAQGELDQSAKQHPKTPGVAIPLVFDTDPYRDCPTPDLARRNLQLPSTDAPSILYLSRHDYKKRPDLLLAAGRLLLDRGLKFNLVFAGPGNPAYMAQLRDFASLLGLADLTTILGMVPAEWKPSLFSAMDLFVLPTNMENFGFVYFESLACATPLVTTMGTDTWRELEQSGGGRIVDRIKSDVPLGSVGGGDVGSLADAIADLIQDRPHLKVMGRQARDWVMTHMDPPTVAERYLEMYSRAARRNPG
jgi:glycosyltransferase involved in cell wall biosynthesis